jgi:hypothetical protein
MSRNRLRNTNQSTELRDRIRTVMSWCASATSPEFPSGVPPVATVLASHYFRTFFTDRTGSLACMSKANEQSVIGNSCELREQFDGSNSPGATNPTALLIWDCNDVKSILGQTSSVCRLTSRSRNIGGSRTSKSTPRYGGPRYSLQITKRSSIDVPPPLKVINAGLCLL